MLLFFILTLFILFCNSKLIRFLHFPLLLSLFTPFFLSFSPLYIFSCRILEKNEELQALNITAKTDRNLITSSERELAVTRTDLQRTTEGYERKLNDILQNEERNVGILRAQIDSLHSSLEGCKNALSDQQKITRGTENELIKMTIEYNTQKIKNENVENITKDNEKLKSKLMINKIENIELHSTIKLLTTDISHRDDSNVRTTLENQDMTRLLLEARKENENIICDLQVLKSSNMQNIEKIEEEHERIIKITTQQHAVAMDNMKKEFQQDILTLQNDSQKLIWSVKQENEKLINNNEKLKIEEINDLKTKYELQINTMNNQNNKDLETMQRTTDNEISNIKSHYEDHINNLQNKFETIQLNDKLERDSEFKIFENKFSALKVETETIFLSDKLENERALSILQEKYVNSEDKYRVLLGEREKQSELTAQYCDEKLTNECNDLLRIQESLELQLITSNQSISTLQFINNELIKVFISCCDAMSEWEEDISDLVEGAETPIVGVNNRRIVEQIIPVNSFAFLKLCSYYIDNKFLFF